MKVRKDGRLHGRDCADMDHAWFIPRNGSSRNKCGGRERESKSSRDNRCLYLVYQDALTDTVKQV